MTKTKTSIYKTHNQGFTLIDQSAKRGFTLIELSIVLVIIGLIVGGVLVGQSLIKGAEVRAAVSQIEKYDAAANTFRNKYHGLPGDLLHPDNFGFDNNFNAPHPNGNGLISSDSVDNPSEFDNEMAAFFRHLSQANLIADAIIGDDFTYGNEVAITDYAPLSKIGGGALVFVGASSGLNYYTVAAGVVWDDVGSSTLEFNNGTNNLRVIDAFQMDSKLDDGVATTGRVRAAYNFTTADSGIDCHSSGVYNTAANANDTVCDIQIRASF